MSFEMPLQCSCEVAEGDLFAGMGASAPAPSTNDQTRPFIQWGLRALQ